MKTLNWKSDSGFTVVELMIVLMILAIITAIAYPSYVDYTRKAKRGEAQQLLLNWAINQEIFRSNNPSYALDGSLVLPKPVHQDGDYIFWAHENKPVANTDCSGRSGVPTATAYLLIAEAQNDQANDVARNGDSCATICLSSNGVKHPAVCWE
jgi:type IV pilus assembly protein PilE